MGSKTPQLYVKKYSYYLNNMSQSAFGDYESFKGEGDSLVAPFLKYKKSNIYKKYKKACFFISYKKLYVTEFKYLYLEKFKFS